jgi:hypothetical protein
VRDPALTACLATAAALALCACGNERTPRPDVATPGPPLGSTAASYPKAGIRFAAPGGWKTTPGTLPLVSTSQTGQATVAVWRYPRTEPLPVTSADLRRARRSLLKAVRTRDKTFRLKSARIKRIRRHPAIEVVGDETVAKHPRRVRSTHIFALGSEVVVDGYAPVAVFRRIDRTVFRPLVRSLRIGRPRTKA